MDLTRRLQTGAADEQVFPERQARHCMQASADIDLDSLLQELCALEHQLNSSNAAKALPQFASSSTCLLNVVASSARLPCTQQDLATPTGAAVDMAHDNNVLASQESISPRPYLRPGSPGNDSAFCDSGSLTSSESILSTQNAVCSKKRINASLIANTLPDQTSLRHSRIVTGDQTSVVERNDEQEYDDKARIRAEKIKLALEKMQEANVKKIYVKFFCGSETINLLIDERWTVGSILKLVAKKFRVPFSINQALIEVCPDMYIERILEDHEILVENILLWKKDSSSVNHFVEKSTKNDLFYNPQLYLLRDDKKSSMNIVTKEKLITEFFSNPQIRLPDTSGILYLKSDGKKSWKNFYFTLRLSGLYVCTKGPKSKSSKDLVCLSQLENIEIYTAIGWKKKYKAPNDFGFALKHPKIQVKSSKYIKYLCAESAESALQWVTALRLAKSGKKLYENFADCCERLTDEDERTHPESNNVSPAKSSLRQISTSVASIARNTTFASDDKFSGPTPSSCAGNASKSLHVSLHSVDNLSSSGCSARGAADSESATEADSDEELMSLGGATPDFFPAPPSTAFLVAGDDDDTVSQYMRENKAPKGYYERSDRPAMLALTPMFGDTSAMPSASDTGTVRRRKPPPVPPKRSDNTRLSTSLSAASSSQSLSVVDSVLSLTRAPAAVAVKPPLPLKPKLAPAPPVRLDYCGNGQIVANSVQQPTVGPLSQATVSNGSDCYTQNLNNNFGTTTPNLENGATKLVQNGAGTKTAAPTMKFQSELQLAMQKRLERMRNTENTGQ